MTKKNIGLDCHDCDAHTTVSERMARKEQCPDCHSSNVEILDAIPEARTIEEAKPFSDTARKFGEDVERAIQESNGES